MNNGSNDNMTMTEGLGEFLRRERELRYIGLDEVAERTKISRRYLEAIEEQRYDRLPAETFVRGFIRSYAQCVGLDPDETLLIYNQSRMSHEAQQARTEHLSPAGRAWNEHLLLWLLITGVVIVGGLLVGGLSLRYGPEFGRSALFARSEPGGTRASGTPLVLAVDATSDTWLRVTIDDQAAQDMVLRAGQSTIWIGRERFILSIGNAHATHLRLNGRDLLLPPLTQSILRQFMISREMLP